MVAYPVDIQVPVCANRSAREDRPKSEANHEEGYHDHEEFGGALHGLLGKDAKVEKESPEPRCGDSNSV